VKCSQTREWYEDWIEDNSILVPPALEDHLAACSTCRDLVELIRGSQATPESTDSIMERLRNAVRSSVAGQGTQDELRERIRQMILSDLEPVAPRPSRASLMLGAAATMLGGAAATALVTGVSGFHLLSAAQLAALSVLAALVMSAFSYVLSVLIAPGSPRRFRPTRILLLSAAGVVVTFGLFFHWNLDQGLALAGARCSRGVLLGSLPTFALLCVILRRGSILEPVLAAAAIAAAAGAGALTAVQLACPMQEASHLLIWHAGPWLLLGVVFAASVWAVERFR
jgi:hypothetical protein